MKKMHFLGLLFLCIFLTQSTAFSSQEWNNRKDQLFLNSSMDKKASTTNVKGKGVWYKKPALVYAAGGILSAGVGLYALFKYIQVEKVVPVQKIIYRDENLFGVQADCSEEKQELSNSDESVNNNDEAIVLEPHSAETFFNDQLNINSAQETEEIDKVLVGAGLLGGSGIGLVGLYFFLKK